MYESSPRHVWFMNRSKLKTLIGTSGYNAFRWLFAGRHKQELLILQFFCRQEGVCQELKPHEHSCHCLQRWGKRAASRNGRLIVSLSSVHLFASPLSAHRVCWQTSFLIGTFLVCSRATWNCSWWCYCDVWKQGGLFKCSAWGELAQ